MNSNTCRRRLPLPNYCLTEGCDNFVAKNKEDSTRCKQCRVRAKKAKQRAIARGL